MRPWPLAVLTLGGCAQLAGIEDTNGDGRVGVSLAIERVSIGTTVVRTPQDLSANTATYLLADAADPALITPVVATETTPGTWSAEIFDVTPPVVFDLPDQPGPVFDRQIALPNRDIVTVFDVLEHPDPVPSVLTDTITVSATLDTPFAGETFELLVIGAWMLGAQLQRVTGWSRRRCLAISYAFAAGIVTISGFNRLAKADEFAAELHVAAMTMPPAFVGWSAFLTGKLMPISSRSSE